MTTSLGRRTAGDGAVGTADGLTDLTAIGDDWTSSESTFRPKPYIFWDLTRKPLLTYNRDVPEQKFLRRAPIVKTVRQADMDAFTAIAHPARRQLLDLLVEEGQSVSQLAARFSTTRPAISQHLKVLLDTGLVSEQRQGRERIYKLRPEPLKQLDTWLGSYRHLWEARLDRLDDYLHELQVEEEKHGDKK